MKAETEIAKEVATKAGKEVVTTNEVAEVVTNVTNVTNVANITNVSEQLAELNAQGIDLMTHNADLLYEAFKPLMRKDSLVGIIERCKASSEDRTKKVTAYDVKVVIPTDGSKADFKLRTRKITVSIWLTSYAEENEGEILILDVKGKAIVESYGIHTDGKPYTTRRFAEISELLSDKGELRDDYDFVTTNEICKSNDVTCKSKVITTLQGSKFHTVTKRISVEAEM